MSSLYSTSSQRLFNVLCRPGISLYC